MTTHYFVAASARFLIEEEPLEEVLKERRRYYGEKGKAIDFWLVRNPKFINAPEFAEIKASFFAMPCHHPLRSTPTSRRRGLAGDRGFSERESGCDGGN